MISNWSGDARTGTGFAVFYRSISCKNMLPVVGSMGMKIWLVVFEPDIVPQLVPMPTPGALVCACNVQPM